MSVLNAENPERTSKPKVIYAYIDHANKVIMDWSPKAGCTVATKMFFRHMGILEEALEYSDWIHDYRINVYHNKYTTTLESLLDPSYVKFKVVRNPYDRFVSIYIHAMRHHLVQDDDGPLDISFRHFTVLFFSEADMIDIFHFRRQKKDYEYQHPNIFNYICKLENISEDLRTLNEETGFNFSLDGLSSDHHVEKNSSIDYCVADKRWSEIQDEIPESKWFYDNKLKKLVHLLYQDDFEAYGY